ncbi:hypothetical protein KDL45_17470 [bacterium]|nr:hypothetical protein [bacterium]
MTRQIRIAEAQAAVGGPIHEVVVHPLDARRETLGLLLAIGVIILAMGLRFLSLATSEDQLYLRPYQRLSDGLNDSQRTLYRSLLATVQDIGALRDENGFFPEAELLEYELIPPFAKNLVPKALQGFVWETYDYSTWVDYIGYNPETEDDFTYILRVIDLHTDYHPSPHPGADYDPNQRLAAQVWTHRDPARAYPGERLAIDGWTWVVDANDPMLQKPPDARAFKQTESPQQPVKRGGVE